MQNNYFHTCQETEKCKCGWKGCTCQTKYSNKKISDKITELYRLCPTCGSVVSTVTQTTT